MSKSAQIRYRAIDRALRRNPAGQSWQQLARACYEIYEKLEVEDRREPSRRTIMEDIRTLRSGVLGQSAPIEYRKGSGYRYTDSSYMFQKEPLGPEDLTTLLNLVDWAEQMTYGQLPAGFSEAIFRLATHLRTSVRAQDSTIQLDRPSDLDGRDNIQPLHHAILKRTALRVTYQEYLAEPRNYLLSPYLLKEYNRRWFAVAYDHHTYKLWTFPLDRIISITESPLTQFHQSPQLQPLKWLDPVIGVIRPDDVDPTLIKIRTTPLQGCYLRTKPLHRSQIEITPLDASQPEFTLLLIPNPELEMQLLSFGDAVEVLEPEFLRQRMIGRIRQTLAIYD